MNIVKSLWVALLMISTSSIRAHARSVSLEEANIPTLDMNEFYNPQTKAIFVEKMSQALQDLGFFAVINTGISSSVLDEAYDAAKAFFALPTEVKMRYDARPTNCQRGYVPPHIEIAKNATRSDFKEVWHLGPNITPERAKELGYAADVWPAEIRFKEPIRAMYNMLSQYVLSLEEAFALAIGERTTLFSEMTREGDWFMRVAYYPPCTEEEKKNTVWAGEHTDIDLFAILPRSTASGLEVKDKDGNWIRVVVPDNAFIMNAGDVLENMTNGYFRSPLHRVVATEDNGREGRYSIILFIHPKNEDDVSPLPSCIARTGGVQKFANAQRWELIGERFADMGYATPETLKKLQESKMMERLMIYNRDSINALRNLKAHGYASEAVLQRLEDLERVR